VNETAHGAWCLVPGAWCLVPGAWCLVLGAWRSTTQILPHFETVWAGVALRRGAGSSATTVRAFIVDTVVLQSTAGTAAALTIALHRQV
jgi:hypothetical protein